MLDLYYRDHAEEMEGFEKNHPLGRFGRAEEVAVAVPFLASEQASYMTGGIQVRTAEHTGSLSVGCAA
ncbi:MAG: SDR family oxidoreductase [Spirochaetales bacterium]|nr:SDR family oxidoreductase [Spirochaetales bacterium]